MKPISPSYQLCVQIHIEVTALVSILVKRPYISQHSKLLLKDYTNLEFRIDGKVSLQIMHTQLTYVSVYNRALISIIYQVLSYFQTVTFKRFFLQVD